MNKEIIVLGYDQGIANAGICILKYDKKTKKKTILYRQYFITKSSFENKDRIKMHYDNLTKLVKKYNVKAVACERLMNNAIRNKRNKSASMMTVNMISSIIMLVAAQNNIKFKEYMPMTVKKHFTGSGKATKDDMINTAIRKYNLRKRPIEHVADAIGIAETLLEDILNKEA